MSIMRPNTGWPFCGVGSGGFEAGETKAACFWPLTLRKSATISFWSFSVVRALSLISPFEMSKTADSGARRARFRNHPGQHSEMMPVTIPG